MIISAHHLFCKKYLIIQESLLLNYDKVMEDDYHCSLLPFHLMQLYVLILLSYDTILSFESDIYKLLYEKSKQRRTQINSKLAPTITIITGELGSLVWTEIANNGIATIARVIFDLVIFNKTNVLTSFI